MKVTLEIPMSLPNPTNLREHWRARAKRTARQRDAVTLVLKASRWKGLVDAHRPLFDVFSSATPSRLVVTLTRVAQRQLDSHDNARSAFKACVDSVAAYFGAPDNDPRFEWRYQQERGKAMVRLDFEVSR